MTDVLRLGTLASNLDDLRPLLDGFRSAARVVLWR